MYVIIRDEKQILKFKDKKKNSCKLYWYNDNLYAYSFDWIWRHSYLIGT
jgi:hypothetical protein